MDKTTAQAQIIAHLMSGADFDYRKIASALAAADPVLFCQLADMRSEAPAWARAAFEYLSAPSQQLIPAIKEIRVGMGLGLKEAKDVCDVFRCYEGGVMVHELSTESYAALEQLRKAAGRQYL